MIIAYSPNSHFNELEKVHLIEIPWYKVLYNPDFSFGRTHHGLDSKGYYYMIITAELAYKYHNDSEIKLRILGYARSWECQTVVRESICFSFIISNTVKNFAGANALTKYILSPIGKGILEGQGLNFFKSVVKGNLQEIPSDMTGIRKELNK